MRRTTPPVTSITSTWAPASTSTIPMTFQTSCRTTRRPSRRRSETRPRSRWRSAAPARLRGRTRGTGRSTRTRPQRPMRRTTRKRSPAATPAVWALTHTLPSSPVTASTTSIPTTRASNCPTSSLRATNAPARTAAIGRHGSVSCMPSRTVMATWTRRGGRTGATSRRARSRAGRRHSPRHTSTRTAGRSRSGGRTRTGKRTHTPRCLPRRRWNWASRTRRPTKKRTPTSWACIARWSWGTNGPSCTAMRGVTTSRTTRSVSRRAGTRTARTCIPPLTQTASSQAGTMTTQSSTRGRTNRPTHRPDSKASRKRRPTRAAPLPVRRRPAPQDWVPG